MTNLNRFPKPQKSLSSFAIFFLALESAPAANAAKPAQYAATRAAYQKYKAAA